MEIRIRDLGKVSLTEHGRVIRRRVSRHIGAYVSGIAGSHRSQATFVSNKGVVLEVSNMVEEEVVARRVRATVVEDSEMLVHMIP